MRSRSMRVFRNFLNHADVVSGAQARDRWLSTAAWALAALFVAIYVGYTLHYSDFNNDDLDNFLAIRAHGFWSYLALPLNVHWVPLHRLLSWFVYTVAPMRFGLAVAVLTICHVGSLFYLYATMRLVQAGRGGLIVFCCYSSCILIMYGVVWWANAQHRLPHVLLLSAAIYHYFRYVRGGNKWHACLVIAACLLDFGFYEKAALIPGYLVMLGICVDGRKVMQMPIRYLWIPGALLAVAVIYVLLYLCFMPLQTTAAPYSIVRGEWEFLRVLAGGLIGVLFTSPVAAQAEEAWKWWLVAIAWVAAFIASIRFAPRTFWVWIAMIICILMDYLPIAISSRIAIFGLNVPYWYRYHFETVYLVAVFAAVLLAEIRRATPARPFLQMASVWSGMLFACIYAVVQVIALVHAHSVDLELRMYACAHDYLHNLRKGLSPIADPMTSFEDTEVPGCMSLFKFVPNTNTLLPLFVPNARFGVREGSRYRVDSNGHVEHLTQL